MNASRDDAGAELDRLALVVVNFASSTLLAEGPVDGHLRTVVGRGRGRRQSQLGRGVEPHPRAVRRQRVGPRRAPPQRGVRRRDERRGGPRGRPRVHARAGAESRRDHRHPLRPQTARREPRGSSTHSSARESSGATGRRWASGAVLDPENGTTRRARPDELDGDRTWQTGACFLATIAMWDVVGGFDDDYFMYWEDLDLSWRWRAAGGSLVLRADATAVHDAGGTQAGTGKSPAVRVLQLPQPAPVRPEAARLPTRPPLVAGQRRVRLERRDARQPADAGEASAAALARVPRHARGLVRAPFAAASASRHTHARPRK